MKNFKFQISNFRSAARLAIAMCLVGTAGCSTPRIQQALNDSLPAGFHGDARVAHKNVYFDVTITARNLRQAEDGRWTWDSLDYVRNGRFSQGSVSLTPGGAR